jgi:hypothetical protein
MATELSCKSPIAAQRDRHRVKPISALALRIGSMKQLFSAFIKMAFQPHLFFPGKVLRICANHIRAHS